MALSAADLVNRIRTEVEGETGHEMPDSAIAVWTGVAEAFTTWLQETGTVVVTSVTGVTPGGGASGPGTGTIQ